MSAPEFLKLKNLPNVDFQTRRLLKNFAARGLTDFRTKELTLPA
jgi:hypothetical protein